MPVHFTVAVLMVSLGRVPAWVDPQADPDSVPPVVVVDVVMAVVREPFLVIPGAAKWTIPVNAQVMGVLAPATLDVLTRATAPALAGMAIAAATKRSLRIMSAPCSSMSPWICSRATGVPDKRYLRNGESIEPLSPDPPFDSRPPVTSTLRDDDRWSNHVVRAQIPPYSHALTNHFEL